MIKTEKIKEFYGFEPKYTFSQFRQNLKRGFEIETVQDALLYKNIKSLTRKAYPSEETNYEKRWHDFYMPLKRRGFFILIPLSIMLYDKRFFLSFLQSQIEVCEGKEKDGFCLDLISQVIEFSRIIKKNPDLIPQALPYDIRTGHMLGKYVLGDLLPAEEKNEILKLYEEHVQKDKKSLGISLHDYLNVAAICYKTFGNCNKIKGLTAEKMYRKWADGRDCGMLKIESKKSKEEFNNWLKSGSHCGGHPFEIVFSWREHGIHLFPPNEKNPYFILSVTDYMYARPFLAMTKTMIRNRVPFRVHDLKSVLDYLSGESYFSVNGYGIHNIFYSPADRKLLRHIKWDEPKILKWKPIKRRGRNIANQCKTN